MIGAVLEAASTITSFLPVFGRGKAAKKLANIQRDIGTNTNALWQHYNKIVKKLKLPEDLQYMIIEYLNSTSVANLSVNPYYVNERWGEGVQFIDYDFGKYGSIHIIGDQYDKEVCEAIKTVISEYEKALALRQQQIEQAKKALEAFKKEVRLETLQEARAAMIPLMGIVAAIAYYVAGKKFAEGG